MNEKRRVVITGMGMISPLGLSVAETWACILAGRSGFGPMTQLDPALHTSGGLCEVKGFEPTNFMSARDARRRDRVQQLATAAAREAMNQSGLEATDANRERIGVYMGTGIGGIRALLEQNDILHTRGPRRCSPHGITMIMPNGAGGVLSIDYGLQGPGATICTACAAGNDAIGHAFRMIQWGELDAALTGGSDAVLTPVAVVGFEIARATSTRSSHTPSPFDRARDGMVIGEGAAMLVLESLSHAQARGATILAEMVGYGQTTDAYHITAPRESGDGAARALRQAMYQARWNPEDVDYINAHGTGTPLNDAAETAAIKCALGPHAYETPVSSTKSMTGHMMGATGALEAIFAALAIRDQVLPPTINYCTPDPECDLDYVPNQARPAQVRTCLSNAFGFGGHNSVLAIQRFA